MKDHVYDQIVGAAEYLAEHEGEDFKALAPVLRERWPLAYEASIVAAARITGKMLERLLIKELMEGEDL